jgi:N-acetylmuramic acid 6-phosphate etherase
MSLAVVASDIPPDRSHIATEGRNPRSAGLHHKSVAELVRLMVDEQQVVLTALAQAESALTAFIEAVEPGFRRGGRLVYLGAGTSGRLGVLDASEAPPTFCVPADRIIGIIAGGDGALRRSSEGKEDEPEGAVPELSALNLTAQDAVLGIAAGGTTPYVQGALAWAARLPSPPVTALMTCADVAAPVGVGHRIWLASGPELLTGSTRMKAGTITKLALNTISTALMVRIGKVHDNLMVDVRATNAKLRDRAARIVSQLTGVERAAAFNALDAAGGHAKTAVVMVLRQVDRQQAESLLAAADGVLGRVI